MTEKQKECTHNFKPVERPLFNAGREAIFQKVHCPLCGLDAIEVYPYSHTEDMNGVKVE